MTTDPIAAARALIESNAILGSVKVQGQWIDGADTLATLADAVEAERALTKRATDGWSAAQDAKIAALERAEKVEAGRDALVAAAYVVAADACKACAPSPAGGPSSRTNSMRVIAFDCASSVRCLTPAHAQAALDKLLAEARLEGWRAGRDAAAQEAEDWFYDPQADEVTDYRLSLNIRMMPEPQEASHG